MCIRDRNTEKEIVEEDAQWDQPDKVEARREPDWQEMMRLMMEIIDSIKESNKQTNEENSRKQNDKVIDVGIDTCLLYTSRCV